VADGAAEIWQALIDSMGLVGSVKALSAKRVMLDVANDKLRCDLSDCADMRFFIVRANATQRALSPACSKHLWLRVDGRAGEADDASIRRQSRNGGTLRCDF
jgi:hypothetical protein